MKRVAIPISKSELSEFFGQCNHYEIFEIEKEIVNRRTVEIPSGIDVTQLPKWLKELGVSDVIAYKVDKKIISLFASNKVNLFVGIAKKTPENLIDDYLQGTLESDINIIDEITKNNV
jgi:predicted Fe-Mo cluster-binding NifX family protein